MRQVPLRAFRTRGIKALGSGNGQNLVILSNRQGPAYFLQPGDLEAQAKANLRAYQMQARELGLDKMSDAEIDAEIRRLGRNAVPQTSPPHESRVGHQYPA